MTAVAGTARMGPSAEIQAGSGLSPAAGRPRRDVGIRDSDGRTSPELRVADGSARVLAPEDFGVMAIGLIAIETLELFSDPGFKQALVQRTGDIDDYLDTAWTVGIGRGFFLGALLLVASPPGWQVLREHRGRCAPPRADILLFSRGSPIRTSCSSPGSSSLTRASICTPEVRWRRLWWRSLSHSAAGASGHSWLVSWPGTRRESRSRSS